MCRQQEAQCVLQDQVFGDLSVKCGVAQRGQHQVCVHLKKTVRVRRAAAEDTLTSAGHSLSLHPKADLRTVYLSVSRTQLNTQNRRQMRRQGRKGDEEGRTGGRRKEY